MDYGILALGGGGVCVVRAGKGTRWMARKWKTGGLDGREMPSKTPCAPYASASPSPLCSSAPLNAQRGTIYLPSTQPRALLSPSIPSSSTSLQSTCLSLSVIPYPSPTIHFAIPPLGIAIPSPTPAAYPPPSSPSIPVPVHRSAPPISVLCQANLRIGVQAAAPHGCSFPITAHRSPIQVCYILNLGIRPRGISSGGTFGDVMQLCICAGIIMTVYQGSVFLVSGAYPNLGIRRERGKEGGVSRASLGGGAVR